jgi:hypothetical protein
MVLIKLPAHLKGNDAEPDRIGVSDRKAAATGDILGAVSVIDPMPSADKFAREFDLKRVAAVVMQIHIHA